MRSGVEQTDAPGEFRKPASLSAFGKVDSSLFEGVVGRTKDYALQFPEPEESRIRPVGSGEENVSVQKQAVHLPRSPVRDRVGIKPEFFHFPSRALVVFCRCRRGEEELRFAFGRVSLDRHNNGGSDEDALLAGLRSDNGAFLDAVAFSQFGWDDDGPALAHLDSFHKITCCQYIRISVFQARLAPAHMLAARAEGGLFCENLR